jgi:hypothetical protein
MELLNLPDDDDDDDGTSNVAGLPELKCIRQILEIFES